MQQGATATPDVLDIVEVYVYKLSKYVYESVCVRVCVCVRVFFAHTPFHASKVNASQRLEFRRFLLESSWPLENGEKLKSKFETKCFSSHWMKLAQALCFTSGSVIMRSSSAIDEVA